MSLTGAIRVLVDKIIHPRPHPAMAEIEANTTAAENAVGRLERSIDTDSFSLLVRGIRGEPSRPRRKRGKT